MGNQSTASDSGDDIFDVDDTAFEIPPDEAAKRVQEKLDESISVKNTLLRMEKNGFDLGTPQGILAHFLSTEEIINYTEPTIDEVLRCEQNAQSNDNTDPRVTSKPDKEAEVDIKFAISEVPSDATRKSVFGELRLGDEYRGQLYTVLVIGPYRIEWDETGIIIPRKSMISSPTAIKIETIRGEETIKQRVEELATEIARYNVLYSYNPTSRNCQHFIDDVCQRLQLSLNVVGQLKTFVNTIREYGSAPCRYTIPERLATLMQEKDLQEEITSQEQLDQILQAIHTVDPDYLYITTIGKGDMKLLEAYGRVFFLRNLMFT
jgi:hypothetical protein